ncbi:hypothetical protein CIT292_07645 [Citrobacter youngae ATCC 29220]|uniref:Uncharacterized protein n=1 Tax=Citrobacter youngae ATCC 29220 TaxID=500640 RepID=D4BAZ8_9ENTR|nr:hypothetical protein CIT292_07645 [Citrobacter youngae ATCC 29220]
MTMVLSGVCMSASDADISAFRYCRGHTGKGPVILINQGASFRP